MIKQKQKVALTNNIICIRNKKFIFNENNLLILNEIDSLSKISILTLYSDYVKYTKLIKYHFSKNYAIFYFSYRCSCKYKNSMLEYFCGINFYLIMN